MSQNTDIIIIPKKKRKQQESSVQVDVCQNIGCSEKRAPGTNQCERHANYHKEYIKKHENVKRRKKNASSDSSKLQKAYDALLIKYQQLQAEYTKLYNKKA